VIDAPGGLEALVPAAQVPQLELVGVDRRVLRIVAIDPTHPVAALLEIADEMVTYEPSSPGDRDARRVRHRAHPSSHRPAAVDDLSFASSPPRDR
jgi:hypothetical protein